MEDKCQAPESIIWERNENRSTWNLSIDQGTAQAFSCPKAVSSNNSRQLSGQHCCLCNSKGGLHPSIRGKVNNRPRWNIYVPWFPYIVRYMVISVMGLGLLGKVLSLWCSAAAASSSEYRIWHEANPDPCREPLFHKLDLLCHKKPDDAGQSSCQLVGSPDSHGIRSECNNCPTGQYLMHTSSIFPCETGKWISRISALSKAQRYIRGIKEGLYKVIWDLGLCGFLDGSQSWKKTSFCSKFLLVRDYESLPRKPLLFYVL